MRHCSLRSNQRPKVAHVVTTDPLQFKKFLYISLNSEPSAHKIIWTVFFKETNSSPYDKLTLYDFRASEPVVGYLTSQKGEGLN